MSRPRPIFLRLAPVSSLVLVLALAAAGCSRAREPFQIAHADPATKRSTPGGDVVGGAGRYGSHAWLGVPYATPPVGELRWRAPQPAEKWSGLREALHYGSPCPQYASSFGGVPGPAGTIAGDEDCLTLDLFAPPFAADAVPTGEKRLPVMVWIHGGGNSIGTSRFYEGGNLAASENVIVVNVQYRLGPLGWMRLAALREGATSDAERSGNFATLDLVRALEWVRDNVSAFGGDPGNVTIFGESAGGQNVYTLLLAPQAKGLFQRAIAQSGGLWRSTDAEAEHFADDADPGATQSASEILLRLLQRDGAADRAAAKAKLAAMGPADVASYLRGKSAQAILAAYTPEPSGMITHPRVFGDGTVLPTGELEDRYGAADGWNRVPVVLGTNRDENRLFMYPDPANVKQVLWIFPRFVDEERYLATADYLARMWKATGADGPAMSMRTNEPKVFVYRFDWDEEPTILGADLSKMLGASHGFEIPFVFGHFDLGRAGNMIFTDENAPGRAALSKAMMSYWAQFARAGDPGRGTSDDLPAWTAWDPSGPDAPKYVVLDTPEGGGIRMTSGPVETPAAVVASLENDARLADAARRCEVLKSLANWSRGYTREQYAKREDCRAYPFAAVAVE